MRTESCKAFLRGVVGAGLLAAAGLASAAATITIVNGNAAGVGFNDPTPVAPLGGNPGTTLGQQRLNAFQYAASVWGSQLDSSVEIKILATFEPLTCTATSAVLGSAGPRDVEADFAGAPVPGTWYHVALANKLAGTDLFTAAVDPSGGGAEIRARFNSRLGLFANCLPGSPFYLGLDNQHGNAIDLVTVLLHEFGHGLGFSTVTDGTTGAYLAGLPSIYDVFAFDNTQAKSWVQMTDAQRAASAINPRQLVWTGANVTTAAPNVLSFGTPQLQVNAPSAIAGLYLAGAASFGAPLAYPGLTRQVMPVVEAGALGQACAALDADNQRAVAGRIALVLRGTCAFVVKAANVQAAGGVGMIVVDNVAGGPPASLGGTDPSITIPAVRVTLADGVKLLSGMTLTPSNRSSGVVARLGVDPSQLAGADTLGRVMLYTPNPFQPGSSVSHWDTGASRNLLMEPAINADLTHFVSTPYDLTLPMLKDIGW
ncbi:MAG TPA: PA domain-containing protein [Burkholderiaceae bacterium]